MLFVPAPFKILEVDSEGYIWAVAGREGDNFNYPKIQAGEGVN